jgi:hypothetical protein
LDLNDVFAKAKRNFTEKKKDDFKSIVAAYFVDSSEVNVPANVETNRVQFFHWLMEKRERHVICRVEGTDDVLLIDALMDWSGHVMRAPPVAWNDFSYKATASTCNVEMQIRLQNRSACDVEPHLLTGVFAFPLDGSIHTWNDRISSLFRDADYQWLDVSDGDLKSPVSVLALGDVPSSNVLPCCWSSRGIENMLLHPTCVLWFVENEFEVATDAFRDIFQTMSDNFFGESGLDSHTIVSCAKKAGPGWMDWHKISFEESKRPHYGDMIGFLKSVIDRVFAAGNTVGSAMLVFFEFFCEVCVVSNIVKEQKDAVKKMLPKYASIFDLISKGCADAGLFQQQLQQIAGASSMFLLEHALMDNEQASVILSQRKVPTSLVPKEARIAFWDRNKPPASLVNPGPAFFTYAFPRFLSFLNSLCCANGISASITAASRSCVSAVFAVLCATPFGMLDDALVQRQGLNSILFRSKTATPCSGYVPRSGGSNCFVCEQPGHCHVLKHDRQGETVEQTQFMRVACRVGSMGWRSHRLMQLVHGTTHLGAAFDESGVATSQQSYRQHLRQHVFGAHPSGSDGVACEQCARKCLALDSLPQIVVEEVRRLQQERRAAFQSLIDAIDLHFSPRFPPSRAGGSDSGQSNSHQEPPQQQMQQQQQQQQPPQQQQQSTVPSSSPSSTLPGPVAAVPVLASGASLDLLACQLFRINLSNDGDVLAQLSSRLQACGVTLLSELEGMREDDVRATVADAKLNPLQFKKLFDAVSKAKP